jgi:hypothetical protein
MAHEETVQERVQELTWALVDDQINDDDMRFLESLMLSDDKARGTYIECIQLHADLVSHFAAKDAQASPGKSPVLSFLNGVTPQVDVQPSPQ